MFATKELTEARKISKLQHRLSPGTHGMEKSGNRGVGTAHATAQNSKLATRIFSRYNANPLHENGPALNHVTSAGETIIRPRVRLLSEQVANQIAAGEVVERPASVVKELVENALDARAARILVEIQAGGRSLIRITDDGLGMSRDDALMSLERHATSKIQKAEDLASIRSMGFRGEALPSIASVSRMTMTTLERDSGVDATHIVVHGGKLLDVRSAGGPPGTCLEVRQLFFNLPARRKFLRSEETEYTHIHHYLTLAALAHPETAFTFVRDGRTVWQLPAVPIGEGTRGRLDALRERMRVLSSGHDQLLPVDFTAAVEDSAQAYLSESADDAAGEPDAGSSAHVRVWGLIGQPGVARANRQDQHLYVNQRPIENRGLNMALMEGYHTALMKGRYPVCCLFLEMDPARVDVNIHPSKREVKFHNERAVRRLVAQAVRQALLDFHESERQSRAGPLENTAPPRAQHPAPSREPAHDDRSAESSSPTSRDLPGFAPAPRPPLRAELQARPPDLPSFPETSSKSPGAESEPAATDAGDSGHVPLAKPATSAPAGAKAAEEIADFPDAGPAPLLQVPLRLVGVVGRLYVVLESDRGLVLMDQHAAHERILFEQMLQRLQQGNAPSQRLLLPETVELSVRDAHFVAELLPQLSRLGVGLSEFGDRTFLLDGLPPFVKASDPRRFVLELIDALKEAGPDVNTHRLGEDVIAKTVCRHAVKANDPLSGPELENLLKDLRQCAMPYTCPHGRPTLIEMSYRELEKKFGRLV